MSKTKIPEKIQNLLWAQSAGRCEYEGCNKILYRDLLTNKNCNSAYIAHIVSDSTDGPRGDSVRSEKLKTDINNLMLLCDTHHRLIDKEQVAEHPESRLLEMKKKHEDRIELLSSIMDDKQSHIVLYGANIGTLSPVLTYEVASHVIVPTYFPAEPRAIELGLKNSYLNDDNQNFWDNESDSLIRQFNTKIAERFKNGELTHISLFALAPIPLLVKLGTLLNDIYNVDVYQKHREPDTWEWQENVVDFQYIINRPSNTTQKPCLVFSLSASITDRIKKRSEKYSIWEFTIDEPNNDFLKGKNQLVEFRRQTRLIFDEIKKETRSSELDVFMAMPGACAVEFGRVWMPKADMTLNLFDYNSTISNEDKFVMTIKN